MTQLQMAAMGTDCLLILHGPEEEVGEAALARAAERVRQYEQRYSRFRPDSELSRLNESPQQRVPVGPELGDLLARSLEYARLSGGLFDPVVLEDLLVLGGIAGDGSLSLARRAAGPNASPGDTPLRRPRGSGRDSEGRGG
jgi:thiamine biosynthesis lipoprotein ApbE